MDCDVNEQNKEEESGEGKLRLSTLTWKRHMDVPSTSPADSVKGTFSCDKERKINTVAVVFGFSWNVTLGVLVMVTRESEQLA